MQKTDAVCVREIQKSLNQSVKKLLENKIQALNVGSLFEAQDAVIKAKNGGQIIFQGMQNHTAYTIKSLEGYDVAWVEEAQSISQRSLDLLRPTIRKPGSELWFSWNPSLETDPVDALLRGDSPPPDAVVVQANYLDNPWLPDVLRDEMEYDKRRDPDKYANVWLGEYQRNSEARVFRNWRIEEFERPTGTIYRLGLDFGFAVDPTAGIRCSTDVNVLYIDHEAVMVGCEIVNTPDLLRRIPDSDKWFITADSARPETISHLQKHGYPKITYAKKGAGSVEDGVEFLKSFDIVVHPRCVETIKELTLYSYKTDPLTGAILPILADKNNHCVPAGVLIETELGLKAIEDVTTIDRVATRFGYQDVLWAGETDADRDILRVETTGGVLYCTPDHEVYTENKGFIRADALSYNDDIINIEASSCRESKQRYMLEKPIDAIQTAKCAVTGFTLSDQLRAGLFGYIGRFGLMIMEKSRKASIFTTKTATRSITPLIISHVLALSNILERSIVTLMRGENLKHSYLKESGRLQKNGTQAKKALKSIERSARWLTRTSNQLLRSAINAAKNLKQRSSAVPTCFAQTSANLRTEERLELTMKQGFAGAEKNTKQTNTRKFHIVHGRVLTITPAGKANKVYDITVSGHHEFFANGVLVHNCIDALRYACEGIRHAIKPRGEKTIIHRPAGVGAWMG